MDSTIQFIKSAHRIIYIIDKITKLSIELPVQQGWFWFSNNYIKWNGFYKDKFTELAFDIYDIASSASTGNRLYDELLQTLFITDDNGIDVRIGTSNWFYYLLHSSTIFNFNKSITELNNCSIALQYIINGTKKLDKKYKHRSIVIATAGMLDEYYKNNSNNILSASI